MFAVFSKSVARGPEELEISPNNVAYSALKNSNRLLGLFVFEFPKGFSTLLGAERKEKIDGVSKGKAFLVLFDIHPRSYCSINNLFCMFQGRLINADELRKQFNQDNNADGCAIALAAYCLIRDGFPPHEILRSMLGSFAFIVYDNTLQQALISVDASGGTPLYWGIDEHGDVVIGNDIEMVKKPCRKSIGPFPKGCFFTTLGRLQSYLHPSRYLKAVEWRQEPDKGTDFVVEIGEIQGKDVVEAGEQEPDEPNEDWLSLKI